MKKFISLSLLMTPLLMNAEPSAAVLQSGPEKVSLLELYTSEGCSSCPPAEKWLSGLKGSPRLWKDFAPVAFHVDYWDRLGWRDPFSDKAFSDRQTSYAESWHSENVYTPAFVLNGKEWLGWRLSQGGPGASRVQAGLLAVSGSEPGRWKVTFEPAQTNQGPYEVHAALLANGISDVKAGENRGRHLEHDFAAVQFVTVPMSRDHGVYRGQFALPLSPNRSAIAVWVTEREKLEAIQAVGGWIPQAASVR